jgi:uncharacterized protein (TIGR02147 family)
MPVIFDYLNYRCYLKDVVADLKRADKKFSHRYICSKLGLSTSNQIMLIIQGKRNLTPSLGFKLGKFLNLSRIEFRYLEYLVSYEHADTVEEKNYYIDRIVKIRQSLSAAKVGDTLFGYFSVWYHQIVRELVTDPDFDGDFVGLASKIHPPISPEQARESFDLLVKWGFVVKKGPRYVQKDICITTGDTVEDAANARLVREYHSTMARLASDFLRKKTKMPHNFTGMTITLSDRNYEELVRELCYFRKRIITLAQGYGKSRRIYHLNLQLFPVSL